jgi:hypothetical protein
VVGRALVDQCEPDPDVNVVGLARRAPDFKSRACFIGVDLLDREDCERRLSDLSRATHVVYAAWQPRLTRADEVAPNLLMLRNLMGVLGRVAPDLRHVTLLQGAKAYGSHLGPFPTPAREDDPRHMPPNFYYDQEDYLAALQRRSRWAWTIFRPAAVYGHALGSPMNLAALIGVYATISRQLNLPLRFPGTTAAYGALLRLRTPSSSHRPSFGQAMPSAPGTRSTTSPTETCFAGRACGPTSPSGSEWPPPNRNASRLPKLWATRKLSGRRSSGSTGSSTCHTANSSPGLLGILS